MERAMNNFKLVAYLASCVALMNCGGDENPLAPSPSTGTYALVTITSKAGNITINAGDVADLDGPGALPEGAITGSLELTETTCTFTFTTTPRGAGPTTVNASGTYTLDGSAITFTILDSSITDTVPVGSDTLTFSTSGNRLTLEDDEKRFVYDKQ